MVFLRDVDQVHDLMDEVAEQQEIANEISEAISNPVGFGHDVDEVSENYVVLWAVIRQGLPDEVTWLI